MVKMKYEHIDFKKYVTNNIQPKQVAKIENMPYSTAYLYMVSNGWKSLRKRNTSTNAHWNKPRRTSSLKYLNSGCKIVKERKRRGLPFFMLKYIKEMEK